MPDIRQALLFLLIVSSMAYSQNDEQPLAVPAWRQALGGALIGKPAAQAGSVVLLCDGGSLKAYSTGGRQLWNYAAGGRLGPYLSRAPEGTSYICRTNGNFIAVNRSGRELWRRNLGRDLSAPALIGWDGRVFVPLEQRVICYTASGSQLWEQRFEHPLVYGPVKDGLGGFAAVLQNNEVILATPFGEITSLTLSSAPAAVLYIPRRGYSQDGGGQLLVLYRNGKAELIGGGGAAEPLPSLSAPPLSAALSEDGKRAAIALRNGDTVLLSIPEKTLLWTGTSHLSGGRNIQQDLEHIQVQYDERGIYVLSPSGATGFAEDGRRLWLIRIQGAAASPAFSDEGLLYSGGSDWILYAYRPEQRVRAVKQSLYGPVPEGNYGLASSLPSPWADYYFRFDEDELSHQFGIIRASINRGAVGAEERAFTAYLMEVAGSQAALPPNRLNLHPSVHVHYRLEAITLLSQFGSPELIPFLAELFTRDRDSSIKAAAAEALGRIGSDPDGLALRAFTGAVFSPGYVRDEQVLAAVARAAGALCRFSGPPLSDAGVRILVALSSDDRPQTVRSTAQREIASLRR
ncbi:PQQ-binding-like beta-propeller repeat protein [Treponema sp. OttesenSCG-928-L16]|nr:PQQ-binding-like beta-propeller repeat protein [Treponema sp. OttesenSCG-928-L16]